MSFGSLPEVTTHDFQRALQNEPDSLSKVADLISRMARGHARRNNPPRDYEPEDVQQSVTTRVLTKLQSVLQKSKGTNRRSWIAYFRTVVANVFIEFIRSKKRATTFADQVVSLDQSGDDNNQVQIEDAATDPSDDLSDRELLEIVFSHLTKEEAELLIKYANELPLSKEELKLIVAIQKKIAAVVDPDSRS